MNLSPTSGKAFFFFSFPLFLPHGHGFYSALPQKMSTYCIAGKFGGLAVYRPTAKYFSVCMYIIMVIPYHTTKFKSANGVKKSFGAKPPNLMIAKFNDRQYFRLYGTSPHCLEGIKL